MQDVGLQHQEFSSPIGSTFKGHFHKCTIPKMLEVEKGTTVLVSDPSNLRLWGLSLFKILARLVDIGDVVEWCAAALIHRIIERWEGVLADVHVASRE